MSGADFAARAIALGGFAKLAATGSGAGGQLVGYLSPALQAVERNAAARLNDWLSVKDFGALGDGVTDDSAAIRKAMRALQSRAAGFSGFRMGTGRLYFPEGVYRIVDSGVLSDFTATIRASVVLSGAGWHNSILWLDPAGASSAKWFYDNGVSQRQWGMVFEDLCFASGTTWQAANPTTGVGTPDTNVSAFGNGFKLTGPGYESGFVFNRCQFRFLQTVVHCAGSNNVDTHRFIACETSWCVNINYIDNPQAFSINWLGCYFNAVLGDFLSYGPNSAGGGGNFLVDGGAVIAVQATGETTPHYVVNLTQGGPSQANAPITFNDVRFELRGIFHGFANATVGTSLALVSANRCSFLNTGTADKNFVTVGGYNTIKFAGCSFSNGSGGGKFKYVIAQAGNGRRGKNGHLMFVESCMIESTLTTPTGGDVTWGGNGGRLTIDHTCFSHANALDASVDPRVTSFACDVFGPSSITGGGVACSTAHRTKPRHSVNPFISNVGGGGSGWLAGTSVQVPTQTRLVEAWIKVDAGQGNANTIRYLIGSDDKSIVYGQTTAAAQNAGAYLKIDLQQRLAETQNICRVRFWTDNGAGAGNTGATTATWSGGLVYE